MLKNTVKAYGPFGFNAANLLATWQPMATSGGVTQTPNPALMVVISNASNTVVAIRYDDDSNRIQTAMPESNLVLPFQAISQPSGQEKVMAQGTTFSIAGTAGVGFIYVTIYY
jgi:hypothetical protein